MKNSFVFFFPDHQLFFHMPSTSSCQTFGKPCTAADTLRHNPCVLLYPADWEVWADQGYSLCTCDSHTVPSQSLSLVPLFSLFRAADNCGHHRHTKDPAPACFLLQLSPESKPRAGTTDAVSESIQFSSLWARALGITSSPRRNRLCLQVALQIKNLLCCCCC